MGDTNSTSEEADTLPEHKGDFRTLSLRSLSKVDLNNHSALKFLSAKAFTLAKESALCNAAVPANLKQVSNPSTSLVTEGSTFLFI